jgi:hypothetical protein
LCNTDDDCQFPSTTATCEKQSKDGCNDICEKEYCGDDVINIDAGPDGKFGTEDDIVEECDDGDQSPGDGCDENCQLESCGDGIKQPSEECDDGCLKGVAGVCESDKDDGDGCDHLCREEFCGDGIKQGAEECDDGAQAMATVFRRLPARALR